MKSRRKGQVKRQIRLQICTFFLAVSMASAVISPTGLIALADVTKKDVTDAKGKITTLEQEKKRVENTIKNLEGLKNDTAAYVKQLDASLQSLENELSELESQIGTKEEQIAQTNTELEAAKETEKQQYESMKLRIQYMYEKGDTSYLEILLQAQSMSEFLSRAEYISQITEYDRKQLDLYVKNKEDIAEHEAQLVAEHEELLGLQESTQAKQASVETLVNQKTAELKSYESKITEAERQASEYQKDIEAQEQAIQEMEAEIKRQEEEARKKAEAEAKRKAEEEAKRKAEEEAKKKAEQANTSKPNASSNSSSNTSSQDKTTSTGNTSFIWPCPSSSRITSSFGGRDAPTEGASSNHQGIDIGASTGSSIVASASGTVVISTYSYSAGNYIMINHGNGIYTVYMHCSKLLASVGDTVKQGEVIAKVGSTGYSTGPHLHFGVRVNGTYVNPRKYVSP